MLNKLWDMVSGKTVQPIDNTGVSPATIEDDECDLPDRSSHPEWSEQLSPISGVPCKIGYTNAKGEISERLITCQRLDLHGDVKYLWAYCHGRAKVCQFKLNRIQYVADIATGELHRSPEEFFSHFSIDVSHRSQPGWGLDVQRRADLSALLNILVFTARCDRRYHPLERASLDRVVCSFWLRLEISGEPDCESILRHADRLAPDAETFWVAMHRCSKSKPMLGLLRTGVREIVDSDGIITPEESYWGSQVDQFVGEIGHA